MFFYRKIWWTRFLHTIFAGMKKTEVWNKYFLVIAFLTGLVELMA